MEERQRVSITTGSWARGMMVVVLTYGLFLVGKWLLVLIASIVIASALEPVTAWARRRGIPRVPTVLSIYVLAAMLLAGFFYFMLLPLIGEVSSFIKTLTIYSNSVVNGSILSGMFETQNLFGGFDTPAIIGELNTYLNELSGFLSQGVFSSISLVFGGVMSFVLMLVLSFYLAVQEDGITKFLKVITPLKHERYMVNLWHRSQAKIGRWLQGQLMLAVLVMVLVYVGLLIIGVPHALLLAVVAGVLELIPLFGPILAAVPSLFVAYTDAGMTTALIVGALYLVIQQLENHVIYPLVVKKVVGVPPMVSILALIVGGQLAGLLGIIIAVPVAAVLMEYLSDLEEKKVAKLSEIESRS